MVNLLFHELRAKFPIYSFVKIDAPNFDALVHGQSAQVVGYDQQDLLPWQVVVFVLASNQHFYAKPEELTPE